MNNSILICNNENDVNDNDGVIIKYTNDKDTIEELQKITHNIDSIKVRFDLGKNSSDYYGLEFSVRIRLSKELPQRIRYTPIILLSDSSNELRYVKNILKRDHFNMLSTDGFYFEKNPKKLIRLNDASFRSNFLKIIKINPPIDRTGNHGVSNRWAIKRWSEVLGIIDKEEIKKNNQDISNQLYIKYLENLHDIKSRINKKENFIKPLESGRVLLIDDESNKGWGDIIKEVTSTGNISFTAISNINDQFKGIPDVVILDLRLEDEDEDEDDIDDMISIQRMDELKKYYNPGIQFIILSATSKSVILNQLYQKKIVGFVKKEHPEDSSIKTVKSISSLSELIDIGLKNAYLKEIWNTQQKILSLNIMKNSSNEYLLSIKIQVESIFDLLDSDLEKKMTSVVLAFYNIIEFIIKFNGGSHGSGYTQIKSISNNKLGINGLDTALSEIMCTRNYKAHGEDENEIQPSCKQNTIKNPDSSYIVNWFNALKEILDKINEKESK